MGPQALIQVISARLPSEKHLIVYLDVYVQ